VNSIEHGSLVDDEGVALMKERGTYLVPTIYVGYAVEKHAGEWKTAGKADRKARRINREKRECLQRAFGAGVKVAYGTDAGVFPHGENAADFRYLVEVGMTPSGAIRRPPSRSRLAGAIRELGSLAAGKFARLDRRHSRSPERRLCAGACCLRDEGRRGLQAIGKRQLNNSSGD